MLKARSSLRRTTRWHSFAPTIPEGRPTLNRRLDAVGRLSPEALGAAAVLRPVFPAGVESMWPGSPMEPGPFAAREGCS
jgi:hypothetical protein